MPHEPRALGLDNQPGNMFRHHQAAYLMQGSVGCGIGMLSLGLKLHLGWVAGLLGLFLAGMLTLHVAFAGAGSAGPKGVSPTLVAWALYRQQ